MKKLFSAAGAIGYILISGFILILLLLAVIEIEQDNLENHSRVSVYAEMAAI